MNPLSRWLDTAVGHASGSLARPVFIAVSLFGLFVIFIVSCAAFGVSPEWISAGADLAIVAISIVAVLAAMRQLTTWRDQHSASQDQDLARRLLSALLSWRQALERVRIDVPVEVQYTSSGGACIFSSERAMAITTSLDEVRRNLRLHEEALTAVLEEARIVWSVNTDQCFRGVYQVGDMVVSEMQALALMCGESLSEIAAGRAQRDVPLATAKARLRWFLREDSKTAPGAVTSSEAETAGLILSILKPRLR